MSSPNGKDNSGPARTRYWMKHPKPTRKLTKVAGMQKRLRASEYTLMQTVADLGAKSDVAVLRNRPTDLMHNRAFAEHQQKLSGALDRLGRVTRRSSQGQDQVACRKAECVMASNGYVRIPHRAEQAALKSAFQTWEDSIRGR